MRKGSIPLWFGATSKWLNSHSVWLNPLLATLTTLASAFIDFKIPGSFTKEHPIKAALLQPIIDNLWWVTILTGSAYALVAVNDSITKKTINKLEKELENARKTNDLIGQNVKSLFDGYLFHLANKAGFGAGQVSSERVTLYIHDIKNQRFIPCGRFSQNTRFSGPGRTDYPEEEGCIGQAWQYGWHFVSLPTDAAIRDNVHHQEYKLKKAVCSKLKMPSVQYAAMRITCSRGKNYGVIVVESTGSNHFSEAILKTFLEDQKQYISELISGLRTYIPKPENAKKKGF